ncbi:MAG: SDR family oxidoreductase [Candidatus Hydrogenedentes bacterium]|nr:SDR family oxidoreductase [Candidatus Hydrogenedentota bacterium]
MKTLIAGCGYVGTALAARLVAEGHEVWALRRTPGPLPEGVEALSADLMDPSTLAVIPEGLDFVFYTAAAGGYEEPRYRAAYVEGPRNLLDALASQRQDLKRVLFTSSTGVYAQQNGEWIDETSPAEQTHFSGSALLEGERVFQSAPWPATIVRLGGIYGPGRAQQLENVRNRIAVCPPEPTYANLIHRDDCAGVLHHLMNLDAPGELYLGVDCEPAERGAMFRWMADLLGVPPPPTAPVDAEGRSARGNKRCSNAKIRAAGYTFAFPTYREGYTEVFAPRGISFEVPEDPEPRPSDASH